VSISSQSFNQLPVSSGGVTVSDALEINTMDHTLPESFTVNNDCYHKRDHAVIEFVRIADNGNAAAYKRTKDAVQQFGYNTLRTNDKWAVKYRHSEAGTPRNKYFTSKKKAVEFLGSITK